MSLRHKNGVTPLKRLFDRQHEVVTVSEYGWSGKKNGDLLQLAEKEFDAFITMD